MLDRLKIRNSGLVAAAVMAVALMAPAAQAQGRRPGGRGGFGGPLSLTRISEVQKELKIDAAQKELLGALGEARRAKGREFFQGLRDLSPEERGKKIAAYRADEAKQVNAILSKTQQKRLGELVLQREGYGALGRPDIQAKLKLSGVQKTKIQQTIQAHRQKIQSLFREARAGGQGGQGFAQMRPKFEAANKDRDTKLAALLSATQKKTWASMQGAKFTFPERRLRRRRPGGSNA